MASALFRQILPLIVALSVVGGIGFVLYHVYLSVTKMGETASQKMGKKNVVLTKDGMRVGVKNVKNEKYVDKTQSYVVKAWNLGQAQEYERYSPMPSCRSSPSCFFAESPLTSHSLNSGKKTN